MRIQVPETRSRAASGSPDAGHAARGLRYTPGVLAVLSPAKSLDFDSPPATDRASEPRMAARADELAHVMAGKTASDLTRLMSLSESLARLNVERYRDWETADARAAILAFDGDVYRGMAAADSFGTRDYTQAQKTVRILSGLYGVLRPLDRIRPYRLEMGTRLTTDRGEDLYDYWGRDITDVLRADLDASPGTAVLVNLASNEYFSAVDVPTLDRRVVSPVFLDARGDAEPRIVSFHAKRARGAMAGWRSGNGSRASRISPASRASATPTNRTCPAPAARSSCVATTPERRGPGAIGSGSPTRPATLTR